MAALSLLSAPATAHVSVTPDTAVPGEELVLNFEIDHGCGDSSTTRLEIKLPDALEAVTPVPSRTWQVERRTGTLVFTAATPLPTDLADAVGLVLSVPDTPGAVLAFPTVQSCAEGQEAWVEVPVAGTHVEGLERPAPLVQILPGGADESISLGIASGEAEAGDEGLTSTFSLGLWIGLGVFLLAVLTGGIAVARRGR